MQKQKINIKRGVLASLALIALSASVSAESQWGNTFNVGTSSGSLTVTDVNSFWTTFTADSNFNFNSVWLNSNSAMAASTSMNVELSAVGLDGKPTGSALASQVLSSAAKGWTQVTGFNYTLTDGTAYALRLSANTGDPSYQWRLLNSVGLTDNNNYVQPGNGNIDPNWARGQNTGSPATVGQAVWMLQSSGNDGFGQPYTTASNAKLASPSASVGQRFRFDAPDPDDVVLTSVDLMLSIAATPPANPLTLYVLDSTGAILQFGTLNLSSASAGIGFYTINLNDEIVLTDGEIYQLALYSNGSAGNSVLWRGGSTQNVTAFIDATFQGNDAYAVTWSSQSNFTTYASTTLTNDYYFGLNLTAIPEPASMALLGLCVLVFALRRKMRRNG